ncbi:hypothetical protein GUITHDRAFT_111167 [Guillardia theta CCMP2712]|uniref:Uncharacterized protein n=1 Tax=Guillardia theta (strain CCMP2712) TaxID=905079 RepID=L1J2Q4_GUITC|nr:hypothetical protein GUITHDRAFT_111167 [Guillardia theta CCMP2712]EKX42798.1 hypothetical protein GUITHDRAFT_111167 [Guillardia theta CCMP2712]|eukprot:XP_005829778.1 hypothetical protein GUITHDRAFT_111167 [Guillardia theta CCMP2712]
MESVSKASMDFAFSGSRASMKKDDLSEVSNLRRSLYDLQQDLFKEKELRQDSDRELLKALSLLKKVVVMDDPNESRQNFSSQLMDRQVDHERESRQLQANLQACKCKLEAVEAELERKCVSYNHLEETMIQLNKLYEHEQHQRKKLEQDHNLVLSQRSGLEDELSRARSECEASDAQLADLREEMREIQEMLSQAVKDSLERDGELKRKARAYKAEVKSKSSKIAELMEENESLLAKVEAMKEEEEAMKKKHRKELERLRANMDEATGRISEELESCQDRLRKEEERRKKLQSTVEELKESEWLKREMEEEVRNLADTLREKDRRLQAIQETHAKQRRSEVESIAKTMHEEHISLLRDQWAKSTEGLDALAASCDFLSSPAPSKQSWAEPRSRFEEFLKEFLDASLHRYLLLLRDLKGSHDRLKDENSRLKRMLESEQSVCAGLEKKLKELEGQLKEEESKSKEARAAMLQEFERKAEQGARERRELQMKVQKFCRRWNTSVCSHLKPRLALLRSSFSSFSDDIAKEFASLKAELTFASGAVIRREKLASSQVEQQAQLIYQEAGLTPAAGDWTQAAQAAMSSSQANFEHFQEDGAGSCPAATASDTDEFDGQMRRRGEELEQLQLELADSRSLLLAANDEVERVKQQQQQQQHARQQELEQVKGELRAASKQLGTSSMELHKARTEVAVLEERSSHLRREVEEMRREVEEREQEVKQLQEERESLRTQVVKESNKQEETFRRLQEKIAELQEEKARSLRTGRELEEAKEAAKTLRASMLSRESELEDAQERWERASEEIHQRQRQVEALEEECYRYRMQEVELQSARRSLASAAVSVRGVMKELAQIRRSTEEVVLREEEEGRRMEALGAELQHTTKRVAEGTSCVGSLLLELREAQRLVEEAKVSTGRDRAEVERMMGERRSLLLSMHANKQTRSKMEADMQEMRSSLMRQAARAQEEAEARILQHEERIHQLVERIHQQEEEMREQEERISRQGRELRQQKEVSSQGEEAIREQGREIRERDEKLRLLEETMGTEQRRMRQLEETLKQQEEDLKGQEKKMKQQEEELKQLQQELCCVLELEPRVQHACSSLLLVQRALGRRRKEEAEVVLELVESTRSINSEMRVTLQLLYVSMLCSAPSPLCYTCRGQGDFGEALLPPRHLVRARNAELVCQSSATLQLSEAPLTFRHPLLLPKLKHRQSIALLQPVREPQGVRARSAPLDLLEEVEREGG